MVKLQRVLLKIKNLAAISLGDARVSNQHACSQQDWVLRLWERAEKEEFDSLLGALHRGWLSCADVGHFVAPG